MNLWAHLWQSTLFAAAAWLITLALRNSPARARYWVWFAGSCKFLLPFSLLVGLGEKVATAPVAPHRVAVAMEAVWTPPVAIPVTAPARLSIVEWLPLTLWACGFAVVIASWWRQWLAARSTPQIGVVGIWRPALVLPEDIRDRLTAPELAAIVEHESCHIRSRDNLTAAIHMLVEAAFWFHPLVWWIERRLVDERERACDEEVLRRGSDPEVYASGILKACEFYLESPLVCAAGVAGSDLKRRIVAILTGQRSRRVSLAAKALLAIAVAAAAAGPMIIGADRAAFEVASVKQSQQGPVETPRAIETTPTSVTMRRQTVHDMVRWAYGTVGEVTGPGWAESEEYDVLARAGAPSSAGELRAMMQTLLADRFKLKLRRETKALPVYTLLVADAGPKMKEVDRPSSHGKTMQLHENSPSTFQMVTNMAMLAEFLPAFLDRPVQDRTGLKAVYEITLTVDLDLAAHPLPEPGRIFTGFGYTPSVFKAVEQLGLKLESQKQPVETIVIDHIERPGDN